MREKIRETEKENDRECDRRYERTTRLKCWIRSNPVTQKI